MPRNLGSTCEEMITAVGEDIGNACVWLSANKAVYAIGRYIAYLMVGKLDPDKPFKPHILC
jgi:hypothetical protein